MPASARSSPPLSVALEGPLEGLARHGEELAKGWVRRVLDRASLDEIERMPTDGIVRELSGRLVVLLRALSREAAGERPAIAEDGARRIARLVAFRGHEAPSATDLAADVADLHWVVVEALHGRAAALDRAVLLGALERVAQVFASIHAAAAEELVSVRSQELERLANTDALTGLHNRRFLDAQLEHLHAVNRRYGHPFSVILFDLVGLKRLNDAYGHTAGDRALMDLAEVAGDTVRTADTVARLSGDEFCVLAPSQDASLAAILAARLVVGAGMIADPGGAPLEITAGVAGCPEHSTVPAELLDAADTAMYRARGDGVGVGIAPLPPVPAGPRASPG